MQLRRAIACIALLAGYGAAHGAPAPACAEVSTRVESAVAPAIASVRGAQADAAPANTELRDCLASHNICSVVYSSRSGQQRLVAGDATADLPDAYGLAQGESSVLMLVRSIPQVGGDLNRYCLISERLGEATAVHHWSVYGWVLAPQQHEALPLPRQVLDENAPSDPRSLRGLAAALWFFAQGMSGHPPAQQSTSAESADAAALPPH